MYKTKDKQTGNKKLANNKGAGQLKFSPPATFTNNLLLQMQEAPNQAVAEPAEVESNPVSLEDQQWLEQISQRHGQDRTSWPTENQVDYETRSFQDSRGANAIPLVLGQAGPVRDEASRDATLALINQNYQDQDGNTNHQRMLLNRFVSGGYDAYAGMPEDRTDEQASRAYKEGGYDQMASYIANNTTVRRSGNNYNHTRDSLRLSQDPNLMAGLHRMGYWEDLNRRVVNSAEQEYENWTSPDGTQFGEGHREGGDYSREDELSEYWGVTRGPNGRANRGAASARDGTNAAWSAVFISHIMEQAGAGDTFSSADAHTNFARAAHRNGRQNRSPVTHPYRLHDSDTEPAAVGGLMHRNRSGTNVTLNNISGESHSDLVVGREVYNQDGSRAMTEGENPTSIRYEDLTPEQIADNNYNVYAVTIGGNTVDQEIAQVTDPTTGVARPEIQNRTTNGSRGGTVGRRYWPLNANGTFDEPNIDRRVRPYGVQRLQQPTEDQLNTAAPLN